MKTFLKSMYKNKVCVLYWRPEQNCVINGLGDYFLKRFLGI